ncbi:MAG: ProQ/FinO family protein [Candidatus Competibacteraceae bacterium]|nr:ProQ/FinO family protein [Candidatus Competibacteraceae bacterium]
MTDPNLSLPTPLAPPERLPLEEWYPACFDWENPRPLKIGIHLDLRARHPDVPHLALRKALAVYCNRARYRKSLKAGLLRWDLQGQPAGLVTLEQGAIARQQLKAGKPAATGKPDLPPDTTPLPEENLVPGRLELTVKFSELPRPLQVQGGMKIGIRTGEGTVTAILPAKVWRKLEQAAKDYPQWVAALSGSLDRFADGEIALKHPALQVFEKKARPEVAAEAKAPDPNAPAAPTAKPPSAVETPKGVAAHPSSTPIRATISLKGRAAPKKVRLPGEQGTQ